MTDNKRTKKRNIYNVEILNRLIKKYGVTKRFITGSLKAHPKDRSETGESISKDYKLMERAISDLLNKM